MTSASELFYSRRSRTARNPDLGLSSTFDRFQRHLDDCRPFPRRSSHGPPHARHLWHRLSQTAEREAVLLDHGTSSGSRNRGSAETSSNRTNRGRITRNDELPGAVIQARERLLERLRGVSIIGNRQHRTASDISWNEFRVVDIGDWEAEILEWSAPAAPFTVSTSTVKPQGLSCTVINSLQHRVFNVSEEEGIIRTTLECCICLESFQDGDDLICLPCEHRFHSNCLVPWVQACGDCPYCRTAIAVDSGEDKNLQN